MSRLIVMIGIPGSGKSTLSKSLEEYGFVRFNADEIRKELYGSEEILGNVTEVFTLLQNRFEEAVLMKQNIVVDNTNVRKEYREHLVRPAQKAGYLIEYVWLADPTRIAFERNLKRDRVVPEDVILNMQEHLDRESPEFHKECDVLYRVKTTDYGSSVYVREKSGIRENYSAKHLSEYLATRVPVRTR